MSGTIYAIFYAILLGVGAISGVMSYTLDTDNYGKLHNIPLDTRDNMSMESISIEEIKHTVHFETYICENPEIVLYKKSENICQSLEIEDYIVGVLLAEMPSWYDEEALRAAAVAARTYALYKMNSSSHPSGADICSDSSHCQAYYSTEDAVAAWNEHSAQNALKKIRAAVESTKGQILTYDNEPILAVYHASSYLFTRASSEVFGGGDVPYLQSVEVPFEDAANTRYSEKELTVSECSRLLYSNGILKRKYDFIEINERCENSKCIGLDVKTKEESVFIKAHEARRIFSLPSGNIEIETHDDVIIFKTYGFGHGVGLSQQGAQIMAQNGFSYDEILYRYYKGSVLAKISYTNE